MEIKGTSNGPFGNGSWVNGQWIRQDIETTKTLVLLTWSDVARRWLELSREVFTDNTELMKSANWAKHCGARYRIEDGNTKDNPEYM